MQRRLSEFPKKFSNLTNHSIILIQGLSKLKTSVTAGAAVVGKTLNCPEHRESLQKNIGKSAVKTKK
jgi:hypothetical protein